MDIYEKDGFIYLLKYDSFKGKEANEGGDVLKEIKWNSPITLACLGIFLYGLAKLLDTIWKYFLSYG